MNARETGLAVIVFGFLFFLAGATFLMDRSLVVSGNILMVVGAVVFSKMDFESFFTIRKAQGLAFFFIGMFFLFQRYLLMGFFLETMGICVLALEKAPNPRTMARRLFSKLWKAC